MIEIETMDKAFPVCFFSLSIYLGFSSGSISSSSSICVLCGGGGGLMGGCCTPSWEVITSGDTAEKSKKT
jgi:hypothetical protein